MHQRNGRDDEKGECDNNCDLHSAFIIINLQISILLNF